MVLQVWVARTEDGAVEFSGLDLRAGAQSPGSPTPSLDQVRHGRGATRFVFPNCTRSECDARPGLRPIGPLGPRLREYIFLALHLPGGSGWTVRLSNTVTPRAHGLVDRRPSPRKRWHDTP